LRNSIRYIGGEIGKESYMLTPFGKLIRQLRLEKDMRLIDLAEATGKSPAFLSAIEVGRKPIPDSYVREVIRAMNLTAAEAKKLTAAADRTRKEVRVDNLSEDQRALMAAFARKLDTTEAPIDPHLSEIVERLRNALKSMGGELPFHRKRRGMIVPAMSADAIWNYAERVRGLLVHDNTVEFPIVQVLEHSMGQIFPDFQFDVIEAAMMGDNEGHVMPGSMTLALREDVYIGACRGNGRDRFTASHELGHFLLHRDVTFARSREEGTAIYYDSEWQADTFAGALMMSQRHLQLFTDADDAAAKCGMSAAAAGYQIKKYNERKEQKLQRRPE
jgi:Zn-dependent peptidase ImmA (M78 family)/transcriptional regulator with XRE-family HTH domain